MAVPENDRASGEAPGMSFHGTSAFNVTFVAPHPAGNPTDHGPARTTRSGGGGGPLMTFPTSGKLTNTEPDGGRSSDSSKRPRTPGALSIPVIDPVTGSRR